MNEKLQGFLREGMKKYREAHQTLQFFEKKVESIIRDTLEKKDNWDTFVLAERKDAIEISSGDNKIWGKYIHGIAEGSITIGRKKHDAKIEVGLCWGRPHRGKSDIIFAGFFEGPKALLNFECKDPRILSSSWYGKTFLYRELEPDYDLVDNLPKDMNLLLDVLQKQIPSREV